MCSYQPEPTITTQRLALRRPRAEDVAKLTSLCAGLDPARLFETDSLVVEHPDHGPIGAIDFDQKDRFSELGCWIGRAHRGAGYATEAISAALVWARDGWGRKVIRTGHAAGNEAAAAVLIKAGFLYTGDVELRPSSHRPDPVPTRMMVWLA